MNVFKKGIVTIVAILVSVLLTSCTTLPQFSNTNLVKVLIIDGQNNHDVWPKSTYMIAEKLRQNGNFTVEVARTQFVWNSRRYDDQYRLSDGHAYIEGQPKTDPNFSPDFFQYDVVISNFGWQTSPWPQQTQLNFEQYMKNGGGFVVLHAANNAFPEWPAFNKMIGLGGWGGRDEKSGPYVYYDHFDKEQRSDQKGSGGGHGKQHVFDIKTRALSHPVMAGLPLVWRHTKDELYHHLRGPAENMTILATAYSDPQFGGSGRHEPVLMAIEYFEGRIFHSTLGHDEAAFESEGFNKTLLQGVKWAASH